MTVMFHAFYNDEDTKIMHLDWEKSKSHLGSIIVGKEGEISSTSTNNLACTQLRKILNFATRSLHEIT